MLPINFNKQCHAGFVTCLSLTKLVLPPSNRRVYLQIFTNEGTNTLSNMTKCTLVSKPYLGRYIYSHHQSTISYQPPPVTYAVATSWTLNVHTQNGWPSSILYELNFDYLFSGGWQMTISMWDSFSLFGSIQPASTWGSRSRWMLYQELWSPR